MKVYILVYYGMGQEGRIIDEWHIPKVSKTEQVCIDYVDSNEGWHSEIHRYEIREVEIDE